MPYTPQNLLIFTAAFSGALAGMGASERVISDPVSSDYAGLTSVAGAFAQSLDTIWAANPSSGLSVSSIEEACESAWQSRSPRAVAPFLTPSTYNSLATAIVAMVQAGGTYFTAQGITPPATNATNPTMVANLAALTALSLSGVSDQSEVKVATLDCFFELLTSAVATDGITIVASSVAGRLWFRKIAPIPKWTNQAVWKANSGTGNNEAVGGVGAPVRDLAEICRRVVNWKMNATAPFYDIQAEANILSTDVWRPTGTVDSKDSTTNNVYSWVLKGTRTTYLAGVVTAGTVASVPALNTAPQFHGGAGFNPAVDTTLIGKMIVIPDGLTVGRDVVAWVQLSTGANLAQVSEFVEVNPTAINPGVTLLTSGQVAALITKAYTIVDNTLFGCSMMSVGVFLDRQRYQNLTFPVTATELVSLRNITGNFITCRIQQRVGASVAGSVILNASGIDNPVLTDYSITNGATLAVIGSSVINTSLTVAAGSLLFIINSVINSGFIESNIQTTQSSQTGNFLANGFSGGMVVFQSTQSGIFNSPRSGLIIKRGAQAQISSLLYGAGNTSYGVEWLEGGQINVLSTITPTITGTAGDIRQEGSATALPALEASAGAVLPAASALSTWAHWTGAPFTRNVMSYKTGARMSNVAA